MEDSLTVRLDEVEQEIVRLLSLRSDDLQIFSSRQDQLLQSHYHSLIAALQTAEDPLEKLKTSASILKQKKEINERWMERQNLKKFWVYCEEVQRQQSIENGNGTTNETFNDPNKHNSNATTNTDSVNVYQTPNTNDSTTNISKTSLSNLCELSLD